MKLFSYAMLFTVVTLALHGILQYHFLLILAVIGSILTLTFSLKEIQ